MPLVSTLLEIGYLNACTSVSLAIASETFAACQSLIYYVIFVSFI